MGLFSGKTGIIMGVANQHSIAAGVAKYLVEQGAEIGYSYLPDTTGKMEKRVRKVVDQFEPKLVAPCDVNNDGSIEEFFANVKKTYDKIDFLVHSIAFAPGEDIKCPTLLASRQGFQVAMETSAYSFIATSRAAAPLMKDGGSIVAMSYFGGEKVVPGYNLMGLAKSALEMSVRYLAFDLGPDKIRVNAISAGPIKTLASSGIGGISAMLNMNAAIAPLGRNVDQEEVGKSSAFLLSDLSTGVTGEILHVDAGFHVMGGPGRAIKTWDVDLSKKPSVPS